MMFDVWVRNKLVFSCRLPTSIQFDHMACTLIYDALLTEYEVSSHMRF